MTQESDEIQIRNRAVLSFDFCSSTRVVEDLHTTGNISKWRSLLIHMKEFLMTKSGETECLFKLYNFTGDGWIVLFEPKPNGEALMLLLKSICNEYLNYYRAKVKPNLDCPPRIVGIKMGMDGGPVVKIRRMNRREEYIGRAINLA